MNGNRVVNHCNCPNCGYSVPFHSEYSTHSVCSACDSLIVRKNSGVENLGKVGELQIDGSPLQLGVQGEYDGKAFQIVGRIQLRFKDGYWNEWYLYYSSGETGWLGEAVGEYFVNTQAKLSSQLPSSSQLGLGDSFSMAGETFVVTGKTTNSVLSLIHI